MNALPLHSVRGLRTLHTTLKWGSHMLVSAGKGRGMGMPHKLKGARDLKSLRELLLLLGNCNYICKIQEELKANWTEPNQKSKDVGNMNGNKAHCSLPSFDFPPLNSTQLGAARSSLLCCRCSSPPFGLSIKARRNKGKLVTWLWGPDDTYKLSTT